MEFGVDLKIEPEELNTSHSSFYDLHDALISQDRSLKPSSNISTSQLSNHSDDIPDVDADLSQKIVSYETSENLENLSIFPLHNTAQDMRQFDSLESYNPDFSNLNSYNSSSSFQNNSSYSNFESAAIKPFLASNKLKSVNLFETASSILHSSQDAQCNLSQSNLGSTNTPEFVYTNFKNSGKVFGSFIEHSEETNDSNNKILMERKVVPVFSKKSASENNHQTVPNSIQPCRNDDLDLDSSQESLQSSQGYVTGTMLKKPIFKPTFKKPGKVSAQLTKVPGDVSTKQSVPTAKLNSNPTNNLKSLLSSKTPLFETLKQPDIKPKHLFKSDSNADVQDKLDKKQIAGKPLQSLQKEKLNNPVEKQNDKIKISVNKKTTAKPKLKSIEETINSDVKPCVSTKNRNHSKNCEINFKPAEKQNKEENRNENNFKEPHIKRSPIKEAQNEKEEFDISIKTQENTSDISSHCAKKQNYKKEAKEHTSTFKNKFSCLFNFIEKENNVEKCEQQKHSKIDQSERTSKINDTNGIDKVKNDVENAVLSEEIPLDKSVLPIFRPSQIVAPQPEIDHLKKISNKTKKRNASKNSVQSKKIISNVNSSAVVLKSSFAKTKPKQSELLSTSKNILQSEQLCESENNEISDSSGKLFTQITEDPNEDNELAVEIKLALDTVINHTEHNFSKTSDKICKNATENSKNKTDSRAGAISQCTESYNLETQIVEPQIRTFDSSEQNTQIQSDKNNNTILSQKKVKSAITNKFKESVTESKDPQPSTSGIKKVLSKSCTNAKNISKNINSSEKKLLKKPMKRMRKWKDVSSAGILKVKKPRYDNRDVDAIKNRLLELQEKTCFPVWVQCDDCHKWRELSDVLDPSELPRIWTCELSTDKERSSCATPQVEFDQEKHDKHFFFNHFTLGSMVWVKNFGIDMWPAMVDDDPDTETFLWLPQDSDVPDWYHVTFFGRHVSRAWVPTRHLEKFQPTDKIFGAMSKRRNGTLQCALKESETAYNLGLEERRKNFCFAKRFRGPWFNDDIQAQDKGPYLSNMF